MTKGWVVPLGVVMVSFVLGCGEQPKVISPDEVAPPPTDEADMFNPAPEGADIGVASEASEGQ